jgi:hypothetical protein
MQNMESNEQLRLKYESQIEVLKNNLENSVKENNLKFLKYEQNNLGLYKNAFINPFNVIIIFSIIINYCYYYFYYEYHNNYNYWLFINIFKKYIINFFLIFSLLFI